MYKTRYVRGVNPLSIIVNNESKITQRRIEDVCDQLECAQSTLESKREELDEKSQLFDTAQERICQLSGELAALQSQPEMDTSKYIYQQYLYTKYNGFFLHLNS